jgi:hypothetical protein
MSDMASPGSVGVLGLWHGSISCDRTIERFRRQYFQQFQELEIPEHCLVMHSESQELIYQTMFKGDLAYLPTVAYRTSVLKRLIARIEIGDEETPNGQDCDSIECKLPVEGR